MFDRRGVVVSDVKGLSKKVRYMGGNGHIRKRRLTHRCRLEIDTIGIQEASCQPGIKSSSKVHTHALSLQGHSEVRIVIHEPLFVDRAPQR